MLDRRLTVQVTLCLVGCLHLIAFSCVLLQEPLLYGKLGLQPVSAYLQTAAQHLLPAGERHTENVWTLFSSNPTLLWHHATLGITAEALLTVICVLGALVAAAVAYGVLHPILFGLLWALYLSVLNVGQAFLPSPGDLVLMEITFACIWFSPKLVLGRMRHASTASEQAATQPQPVPADPPLLLLRWLLFKLLLLSSSTKLAVACSATPRLADCFKTLTAYGPPHLLTRLYQSLLSPVAAIIAAVALLELLAAFLVLIPAPSIQRPAAAVLLTLQLGKLLFGSSGLLNLATAVLCVALMDDSMVQPALQQLGQLLVGRNIAIAAASAAGDAVAPASGAASAELFQYKGRHKRSMSNDSLASLFSEPDLQQSVDALPGVHQPRLHVSRHLQIALAVMVVAVAAAMFGYNSTGGLMLRPAPASLVNVLSALVPAAAGLWLLAFARAALQHSRQAIRTAAYAHTCAAATKIVTVMTVAVADADSRAPVATKQAEIDQAKALARTAAPQLKTPAGAAKRGAGTAADASEAGTAEAATIALSEGQRAEKGIKAAAGAPSTPRKGGRGRAAAAAAKLATAAATPLDGSAEDISTDTAAVQPSAAIGRRGAAARARKQPVAAATEAAAAAAAAAAQAAKAAEVATVLASAAEAAAVEAVTMPGQADIGISGAVAAKPAANAVAEVGLAQHAAAQQGNSNTESSCNIGLVSAAKIWLPALRAVLTAVVALAVFWCGLPAVLLPAGFHMTTLRRVPGLVGSYHHLLNFGVVSSASSYQHLWQPAAEAAAHKPGSYLIFEVSTSEDGTSWRPLHFKHGISSDKFRQSGSWLDPVWRWQGPYEPRLQGKLTAAGGLTDNLWLLSLADRVLEGDAVLQPALLEPVHPYNWVKIDQVLYSPTSQRAADHQQLDGAAVQHSSSSWDVKHIAEILPPLPRGNADLNDTLAGLGWLPQPTDRFGAGLPPVALLAAPGLVVSAILLLVAMRHWCLPGGLIHSSAAQ